MEMQVDAVYENEVLRQVDTGNLPPGNTVNPVVAQPLYLALVPASAGLPNCPAVEGCNLLIVATLNGSIFAFNAGDITHGGGTGAGLVVWQRTGQTASGQSNYLWFDDCTGGTAGPSTTFALGGLPFAGIVSTPVIDTNATPHPVMYVTSLCSTSLKQSQQWWIHQIDLYTGYDVATHKQIIVNNASGGVPGSDSADDTSTTGIIPFNAWEALQRSALLKVSLSGTTPNPLIYVAFGFGTIGEVKSPYHGWIFAYDSGLNQQLAFNDTSAGEVGNSNSPACTTGCTECVSGSCPPSSCLSGEAPSKVGALNWCGHAGGVWMSSRGAASSPDPSGVSHAYFGTGNGGFQLNPAGATSYNWGSSILDFTGSSSGFGSSPSEYFTPNGNAVGGGSIPVTYQAPPPYNWPYTYQGINQSDFDLSTSGIALFSDTSGNRWLLDFDKAGYGYLLRQGNLCGDTTDPTPQCFPGAPTGYQGFATGDPGNVFPFAGNVTQCTYTQDPAGCDRITSLAFDPDSTPQRLFVWPSAEGVASLEFTGNQPITPAGTIQGSNGTTVCGNSAAFSGLVVPGDTITDTQSGSADDGESRIVTVVNSSTQLTASTPFTPNIGSCTAACVCSTHSESFSYQGYFTNPVYNTPVAAPVKVQYPGGSVVVTSNSGSGAVLWGLANVSSSLTAPTPSALFAYAAANVSAGPIWCTNSSASCTFSSISAFTEMSLNPPPGGTAPSFGIPTINNGYVYIPTQGITSPCPSSECSGVLVYTGH